MLIFNWTKIRIWDGLQSEIIADSGIMLLSSQKYQNYEREHHSGDSCENAA